MNKINKFTDLFSSFFSISLIIFSHSSTLFLFFSFDDSSFFNSFLLFKSKSLIDLDLIFWPSGLELILLILLLLILLFIWLTDILLSVTRDGFNIENYVFCNFYNYYCYYYCYYTFCFYFLFFLNLFLNLLLKFLFLPFLLLLKLFLLFPFIKLAKALIIFILFLLLFEYL